MTKSAPALAPAAFEQGLLIAAGVSVAELLPAPKPLSAGTVQPGPVADDREWAGAVIAHLNASSDAMVGILVGPELVEALAASPLGNLELADAVQPALDAAAAALGATAMAAQGLNPATVSPALTATATVIPLLVGDTTAAVFFAVPPTVPVLDAPASPARGRGIELLHGVAMEVTVELGRTRMSVRDLLALTPGDVLELDRPAGSPADLLVNGRLIARGEVVVLDEDFALRVTEIVTPTTAG